VGKYGHDVGVVHMREHKVCSDFAIKTIQIAFPEDNEKNTEERQLKLNELEQSMEWT